MLCPLNWKCLNVYVHAALLSHSEDPFYEKDRNFISRNDSSFFIRHEIITYQCG